MSKVKAFARSCPMCPAHYTLLARVLARGLGSGIVRLIWWCSVQVLKLAHMCQTGAAPRSACT